MELNCSRSWEGSDIFTIRMKGDGSFIKNMVATLVEDFNEPKFGYYGENYDEYHDDEMGKDEFYDR